ncbi:Colicin I receptor precursor [Vibrio aerogenes CECT 7868]|uniref:Colicin I receptor n=1 Tax=Vibrio aerogenes CECT 7868 TaxID=1216006 RepID=A0A1M5X3A9_9VIBR|nr:TonB-dependent receptor [Vibrio aerogenes]SHH93984.1 Colicin I receptor precursor [Vibrio aerogenes CECT 7868]
MNKANWFLMSASAVLITPTGYAEDQTFDTVVVTASGYQQESIDAPASVSVISRQEIEKSAYRNIGEILKSVPGLTLTGSATGQNISIRGMPSDYTLILVDGRPQASRESQPSGSAGFDQEWLPPLSEIERIEVIRGPASTLYGSEAMGGVINVITRRHSDSWRGNLRLEAIRPQDSEFGTSYKSTLSFSGPLIDNKLSLQLSASYYQKDEDDVSRGSPDKDIDSYLGKISYTPTSDHHFDLDFSEVSQTRETTLGKSAAASARNNARTDNRKKVIALTHTGQYHDVEETTYLQYEKTTNKGRDIRIRNTVLNTSWVLSADEHITTIGGNLTKARLTDNTTNALSDLNTISDNRYALFAENQWFLTDTLSLVTGLRGDKSDQFDEHFSPRVYGIWSATENWTLKAGVSTGYRAPELRQMTPEWAQESGGRRNPYYIYGNADLKPETSVTSEISTIYHQDDLAVAVTAFDNQFKDKITRTACPDSICAEADSYYYINIDKAQTRGAELSARYAFNPALSASLSYTYTRSKQRSGENQGQPLSQIPLHLAVLSAQWSVTENASLWASHAYHGKESEATGLSSNTETRAPSYHLFDLGMGYRFGQDVNLNLGVNNLFNQTFSFAEYGYVDSGREYWATLDVTF